MLAPAERTAKSVRSWTISIGMVKTHVHHIYEKVGVSSREELRDRMQTETIGAKSTPKRPLHSDRMRPVGGPSRLHPRSEWKMTGASGTLFS